MFSTTFILLLLCIGFLGSKKLPRKIVLLTSWLVSQTLVSVLISSQIISFSFFNKMALFLSTILSVFFVSFYPLNKITIQWIYRISMCQSAVFIIAYFFDLSGMYGIIEAVTFGFANPNFTGMWILHLICINFVYFIEKLKKKEWFFLILLLTINIFQIYFLFLTKNRASILGIIIFSVGLIINSIRKHNFFTINEFVTTSIPGFIVIIYFWINASGRIQVFQMFSTVGKELTSRINIWREGLNIFVNSPLWGEYYTVIYSSSFSQMHNVYIDLLASYGGIVTVLFFTFLFYMLKRARTGIATFQQSIAYWGITAVLVASGFEAALVSGSTGMHLMTCALFILSNQATEREND